MCGTRNFRFRNEDNTLTESCDGAVSFMVIEIGCNLSGRDPLLNLVVFGCLGDVRSTVRLYSI